jgi:outer membrane protein insertion porin family
MLVSRVAAVLCAAVLIGGVAPVLADVDDYLGRTVVAVSVQSEGRTLNGDARLMSLIETAEGRPLAVRQVRESIAHLYSLAIYEDVRVHASLTETGVALVYELVPLHPVQRIEFEGGGSGIDAGRLRQRLVERFGQTPRATRADEMARDLEVALHDVGYLRARVQPDARIEHSPERTVLTFRLDPGTRARVGAVTVSGDTGLPEPEFLRSLRIGEGRPYERDRINERADRYLAERRERGHYEASLAITPTFTDADRVVNLAVAAAQGPVVRVVFEGDPVPADQREALVPIAREGSVDEDLLEDASNRIEEFLRAQGYRNAAAPHTREQQGDELLVRFTVTRGSQYRVESVDVSGNRALTGETIAALMRVRAGQPFSAAALDGDLTQIEEAYRRTGFASVRAEAATDVGTAAPDSHVPVAIRIEVTENAQTLVNSVRIEGNGAVPASELNPVIALAPGQPYSTYRLALDRDAIELKYANLGFQSVNVEARPGLNDEQTRADVVFVVREGPRVYVDHVLIAGNARTKTATIERELRFKEGDALGLEALSESQRRLAALGLFRRVRISQLGQGDETRRDVLVSVEEAPLTTIGYGGGLEVRNRVLRSESQPDVASEKLEFAPRASFDVSRRNLFGTNRSVSLFTSLSLHPTDFATQDPVQTTDNGLPEYRVLGQFRQPRIFASSADFRVTGTVEQQIRSSFNYARRSIAADLAVRLPHSLSATGGYQLQRTRVFDQNVEESQQPEIDRLFPKVRLSSFVGSLILDTRDDPVDPTRGQYASASGQVAARAIGSEVGFFKSYFTAETFRTLPGRGIVFAASARLGAAVGFPSETGTRDLPASERFYAGGDTTVRGFALDRLGVRHDPPRPTDTIDEAGFPLGGNALLIFNAELRVPVRSGVRVVGFADIGNVYKTVSDVMLDELRPAFGAGFRYKSPVGPLRFDVGFKLPRHPGETRTEWFITFGEAF